jgi:hypothetical protein
MSALVSAGDEVSRRVADKIESVETKPSGFLLPSTGDERTKAAAFKSLTKRKEEADRRLSQQEDLTNAARKELKTKTEEFEKTPFMGGSSLASTSKVPGYVTGLMGPGNQALVRAAEFIRAGMFSTDPDTKREGKPHLGDWRALVPDVLQQAYGGETSDDPVGFRKSAKKAAELYDEIQGLKSQLEVTESVENKLRDKATTIDNALVLTSPRKTDT